MRRDHIYTSDDETRGLADAQAVLTDVLQVFASTDAIKSQIGSKAVDCLQEALGNGCFRQVSSVLRESLCVCCSKVGFDSRLFWELIDAINFFYDAHQGAWPYTTHDGRMRYIRWSIEGAESVRSSLH